MLSTFNEDKSSSAVVSTFCECMTSPAMTQTFYDGIASLPLIARSVGKISASPYKSNNGVEDTVG